MEKQKMMHVGIYEGQVGKYVFLPDSPEGSEKIASYLENAEKIAYHREYLTYTGTLDGVKVSVTSTGIGGPSTGIAVEELFQCGADTMIRVGTCGSVSPEIKTGDLVIPNGAVRMEGVANHYLPLEYPAVPDHVMLKALQAAAIKNNSIYHIAPTISSASYYTEFSPDTRPVAEELKFRWNAYLRGGASSTCMECAALFVIAGCLGARAASSLVCQENDRCIGLDNSGFEEEAILTAIEGMKTVIRQDRAS